MQIYREHRIQTKFEWKFKSLKKKSHDQTYQNEYTPNDTLLQTVLTHESSLYG